MKIINLTPHTVNIFNSECVQIAAFPPSGKVARVSVSTTKRGIIPIGTLEDILAGVSSAGIPVVVGSYGAVTDLPQPEAGTVYIVSALVRTSPECKGRVDVLSPADLVRDASGNIIGCKSLEANR